MSGNIAEFPDRGTIEQEAGAWLIRLDSEIPLSREEQASLRQWYRRSPAHREELKSLAALWNKMNILTELTVPLEKPAVYQKHSGARWSDILNSARRAGAVAAVLVIGVVAGLGYWWSQDPLLNSNGLYTSAVGQQQTVTLADGSVIQLNTNTRLQVEYGKQYRTISLLQGEAYFSVAKNAERPFQVYAGSGLVRAVGTAFSVYLKDQDINVAVTEGRVALASLKAPTEKTSTQNSKTDSRQSTAVVVRHIDRDLGIVDAGQGAIIKVASALEKTNDRTTSALEVEVVRHLDKQQFQRRLSWRNGLLVFAGDPLQEVVDEISRYTTLRIEITDPEIKAIKIGGQFRVGDTDGMFDSLEANFGLRVIRLRDGHVRLALAE